MENIPISEAKDKLASLVLEVEVAAARKGYAISIDGHPSAELRPFVPIPTPGRYHGRISFDDDAFAPLTDAEAGAWGV